MAFIQSTGSFVELTDKILQDDRYRPWPNMMNKGNESWKDVKDPFLGLKMRWIAYPDAEPITWENRPLFWDQPVQVHRYFPIPKSIQVRFGWYFPKWINLRII